MTGHYRSEPKSEGARPAICRLTPVLCILAAHELAPEDVYSMPLKSRFMLTVFGGASEDRSLLFEKRHSEAPRSHQRGEGSPANQFEPMLSRPARNLAFALLLALLVLSAFAGAQSGKYPPTIVFMTDFGVLDDSVAICRGVMYSIMPDVRIVDLTHEVTPFSILDGARFLAGATPYYPAGTVFVVVIDPTVGSTRKAIVAKSKRGQYFVLPDNGLLTLVEQRDGIEGVHEITNPDWMIGSKLSSTFHGRDIFSPAGAHVAR